MIGWRQFRSFARKGASSLAKELKNINSFDTQIVSSCFNIDISKLRKDPYNMVYSVANFDTVDTKAKQLQGFEAKIGVNGKLEFHQKGFNIEEYLVKVKNCFNKGVPNDNDENGIRKLKGFALAGTREWLYSTLHLLQGTLIRNGTLLLKIEGLLDERNNLPGTNFDQVREISKFEELLARKIIYDISTGFNTHQKAIVPTLCFYNGSDLYLSLEATNRKDQALAFSLNTGFAIFKEGKDNYSLLSKYERSRDLTTPELSKGVSHYELLKYSDIFGKKALGRRMALGEVYTGEINSLEYLDLMAEYGKSEDFKDLSKAIKFVKDHTLKFKEINCL